MALRRGPDLPYSVIAGVTPWGGHWLLASAKLHGATFAPDEPRLFASFKDILDDRPAFSVIVVNAPIGYRDSPDSRPRSCDVEARALLGWRSGAVHNAPSRALLEGQISLNEDHLDAVSAMLLPRYREIAAEMSPFRQRVVYEGHPELSFFQLNADSPIRESKRVEVGLLERGEVLTRKVPGSSRILDANLDGVPRKHLYDAAALLWTARRVMAHAAKRIPLDPEWDSQGLRMEIVY